MMVVVTYEDEPEREWGVTFLPDSPNPAISAPEDAAWDEVQQFLRDLSEYFQRTSVAS